MCQVLFHVPKIQERVILAHQGKRIESHTEPRSTSKFIIKICIKSYEEKLKKMAREHNGEGVQTGRCGKASVKG